MSNAENKLAGTVHNLAELLSVQDGAVVSRVIAKTKTASVTLFAFDTSEELSEHTAPFDALVQVLEGALEVRLAGEPHKLRAGQLLIMPRDVPHALRALEPLKMLLTMLRE